MNKGKKKGSQSVTSWHRYLTAEIGIEFKACLYFFTIVFFYSMYRIIGGNWEASIIHLAEMIATTYVMGYIQVYLFSNFDEAERFAWKEFTYSVLCTCLYTGISVLCSWFDRKISVTIYYSLYTLITYPCAFGVYKVKRDIDTRLLNEELKTFKERRSANGTGN